MDLVARLYDVAQIDADAELHLACGGNVAIALAHRGLNLKGALDGTDVTGKLGEQAITGRIDDASSESLDQVTDDGEVRLDAVDRRILILFHETGVARDVRCQDGNETALMEGRWTGPFIHGAPLRFETAGRSYHACGATA